MIIPMLSEMLNDFSLSEKWDISEYGKREKIKISDNITNETAIILLLEISSIPIVAGYRTDNSKSADMKYLGVSVFTKVLKNTENSLTI